MKKLKLMKTLLVAVGLCVGANAWADTETVNILSENYESYTADADIKSSLESAGWTFTGKDSALPTATCTEGTSVNTTKYANLYYGGAASRQQYWNFANSVTSALTADNWTLTFSAAITPGNKDAKTGIAVSGTSSTFSNTTVGITNPLFSLYNSAASGTDYTAMIGATTLDGTYTLTSGTWYKFTIRATNITNSTATIYVKVTSYDETATVLESTQTDISTSSIGTLKGIVWGSARYNPRLLIDDVLLTKEVDASVCAEPTSTISGVSGTSRKFTLACETPASTIYYSETEKEFGDDGWIEYTSEVTTAATTIYAYASTAKAHSSVINFATGAGTAITLHEPTFTKTAYSAGKYTVSISSDQSDLSVVPTTHVIKYSIDGGDAATYSSPLSVSEGSTVSAYVELSGYTTSSTRNCATAARPTYYATSWTQDYRNITSAAGTGLQAVGLSASADFTVNETDFFNILTYGNDPVAVNLNTNVGLNTSTGFGLRCYGANSGILKNTGSGGMIGIKNLKAGDYIVMTVANFVPTANYGVTYQEAMSTSTEYYFLATGTEASINIPYGVYNYTQIISVLSPTVSKTITSAGWATYCSPYALDFSGVSGLKAYIITGATGSTLNLTQVNNVPANKGVLLEGAAGNYDIPVVASSSTDVSANKLVGVTSTYELAADGGYVLLNGENGVGFYINPNEAFTVGANTAYLPVGFAAARAFYLFDEDATGINAVSTTKAETGNYYNLAGQRVAQPTKGLYIVNGKKYVVK